MVAFDIGVGWVIINILYRPKIAVFCRDRCWRGAGVVWRLREGEGWLLELS